MRPTKVHELQMKVQDLLTDEDRWTQGVTARNQTGDAVFAQDPEAVCWCLVGAVIKSYPITEQVEVLRTIRRALQYQNDCQIYAWNDHLRRTFEEVHELVVRLDI